MLYHIISYYIMLYYIILCYIISYYIMSYYIMLYYIILCFIILYCIILDYIVLHCIIGLPRDRPSGWMLVFQECLQFLLNMVIVELILISNGFSFHVFAPE